MDKRADLAQEMIRGQRPVSELCAKYNVSRPTAYRWKKRFLAEGRAGMAGHSRCPQHSPRHTPPQVEQAVCAVREAHPTWGGLKIHRVLLRQDCEDLPCPRTVDRILERNGYVHPQPHHETVGSFVRGHPNELWQIDFKGGVALPQRPKTQKAIPFTVEDDFSRFNIVLAVLPNQRFATLWPVLWEAMAVYGLPEAILTDNQGVFRAPRTGISTFTAHLWRLGIEHISGRIRHPQTQGKVERLHGTIQRDVIAGHRFRSREEVQFALDEFREVYNHFRPHQALQMRVPAQLHALSPRPRPPQLPPVEYPPGSHLRRIPVSGCVTVRNCHVNVGEGLTGEHVRLEDDDGELVIRYANHVVRRLPWDQLRPHSYI